MKAIQIRLNEKLLDKEFKRLSKQLNQLDEKEVPRGVSRVINREAEKAKTKVVRRVAKNIGIKQKLVRDRVFRNKARPNRLVSRIWAGQDAINALNAGARKTDDGFKLGPYEWQGAFQWNGSTGGKPVALYRDPNREERGPLRESNRKTGYPLLRAEIGQQFVAKEVREAMDEAGEQALNRDLTPALNKELTFRLNKTLGKK